MRPLALLALLSLCPGAASAQEAAELIANVRNGGGWVGIPIEGGRGKYSTVRLPTLGMTVEGCITVWPGHSGTWELRAHDVVSDSSRVIRALPGKGVTFSHTFGLQAQLDFDFRWSEPRDTTLVMWVGIAVAKTPEEACEPVYEG